MNTPTRIKINDSRIPLPIQMMLVDNDYQHKNPVDGRNISVTTIIRPMRQMLMAMDKRGLKQPYSIPSVVLSADMNRVTGLALHKRMENAIAKRGHENLRKLNVSPDEVNRVMINPILPTTEDDIVVQTEHRGQRKVNHSYTLTGIADLIWDGVVIDLKAMSGFLSQKEHPEHKLQLSLLRFIMPKDITKIKGFNPIWVHDFRAIEATRKGAITFPVWELELDLFSLEHCKEYVEHRIDMLVQFLEGSIELPQCSDADLWRGETKYQYWRDPSQTKCSSSHSTYQEASRKQLEKGTGFVVERKAPAVACGYCSERLHCSQRLSIEKEM